MKIQYIKNYGLFIPKLESRPMGVNLPLLDYATGKKLSLEEQILDVTEKEGRALVRSKNFIEVKASPKKKIEEVRVNE